MQPMERPIDQGAAKTAPTRADPPELPAILAGCRAGEAEAFERLFD